MGHSHERDAVRVFRLSRIRGKVGYSSKAEHDFQRPDDFDPRAYATRADWQLGEQQGVARIWLSDRIEWLVRRHLGPDVGHGRSPRDDGVIFETAYGDPRQLISWVLGLGNRGAHPGAARAGRRRPRSGCALVVERHSEPIELAKPGQAPPASASPRRTASARARSARSASRGWSRWPAS